MTSSRGGCSRRVATVRALALEGNTDEGAEHAFDLLGNLGLYMASLRRHELTNPAREQRSPHQEASVLGLHIGASLGVVPRFATSHLATHNLAYDGRPKAFTSLVAERLFLDTNTRGIFAVKRAADALTRIVPLGISTGRQTRASRRVRRTSRRTRGASVGPQATPVEIAAGDLLSFASDVPHVYEALDETHCLLVQSYP